MSLQVYTTRFSDETHSVAVLASQVTSTDRPQRMRRPLLLLLEKRRSKIRRLYFELAPGEIYTQKLFMVRGEKLGKKKFVKKKKNLFFFSSGDCGQQSASSPSGHCQFQKSRHVGQREIGTNLRSINNDGFYLLAFTSSFTRSLNCLFLFFSLQNVSVHIIYSITTQVYYYN